MSKAVIIIIGLAVQALVSFILGVLVGRRNSEKVNAAVALYKSVEGDIKTLENSRPVTGSK